MRRFALKRSLIVLFLALLADGPTEPRWASPSSNPASTAPEIATFSIVACDTAAGVWGVAVASRFFAVGSVVPWARGEVGAIATQAQGNTTFGPRGLDLLERGLTAEETMAVLLRDDPGQERRQVGIVDRNGGSVSHTGTDCLAWAGGKTGFGYACQGNILTGPEVVDAMARTFEATPGFLGDRLLAALDAGEAAGGDSRGKQSAALKLAAVGQGYAGFNDVLCDIRVDDHAEPFQELRRIYNVWRPGNLIQEGYRHVEHAEYDRAIACGEAAAKLDPESGQPFYHLACYYSRAGKAEQAMHYLLWAFQLDPKLKAQALTDTDLTPLQVRSDWKQATR